MNAFEAYWFIYNHPNCVDIDPAHPLVNAAEYAHPGFKTTDGEEVVFAHDGKPRDAEYERGLKENAMTYNWTGQFIHNMDFGYMESEAEGFICWIETGPAYFDDWANKYRGNCHDIYLDVHAPTFDEALIKLAAKIKDKYGNYDADALSNL